MTAEAIVARGLTKVYGRLTAVDHVDLTVATGGIFGLLGPNGAGKTTIIKMLTGLSEITSGTATVAGFDVRQQPMHAKQHIGWVAAEVILDDDLSAWENLWLQAQLQRMTEWTERARALLRYFDLDERRGDKVGGYSTGMRKKLEIALALLHQPEVIFMDEPTIGLDANTRRMLWELIRGVNREFKITVLLTSHYIEEADALCDHVAIIDHGRFVAQGTPDELKARVRADFIELETRPPMSEAQLRELPGVLSIQAQGSGSMLKVVSADETLAAIFARVDPRSIHRVNVERPSLESVFVDLTGSRMEATAGDVPDYRKFYANLRRAQR